MKDKAKNKLRLLLKLILVIFLYVISAFLLIGSIVLINDFVPDNYTFVLYFLTLLVFIIAAYLITGFYFGIIRTTNNYVRIAKVKRREKSSQFKEICIELEQRWGNVLKQYRKKAILYILLICMITILYICIIFKYIDNLDFDNVVMIYLIIISPILAVYELNNDKYKNIFSNKMMPIIINSINSDLQYDYEGSEKLIDAYRLSFPDSNSFNMYNSTDYIYGKSQNTNIRICKISLQNYDEEKKKYINTVEAFLFSWNKLQFKVPYTITIEPNEFVNRNNKNRVDMDSKDFEKYFDVYSDFEINAMQVLTHDVMEELYSFYQKYRVKLKIIIKDDNIFIKFQTGDVFKPPKVFTKVTNSNLLWIYYVVIEFVTNFSIKLNKALEGIEI